MATPRQIKRAVDALAWDVEDVRRLSEKLFEAKRRVYRRTLLEQARFFGYDVPRPRLSDELVEGLRREARDHAAVIATTYNRELRRHAARVGPAIPRERLQPALRRWTNARSRKRARMVAITEAYSAHADATLTFFRDLGIDVMLEFGGHPELSDAPPACPICIAIAAGNPYTLAEAAAIGTPHPQCLVGETLVAGAFSAVHERLYEGEIVVVHTARGGELAITPNHPILTTRGRLSARAVHQGDYLLRCLDAELVADLTAGPHEQQQPLPIGDVAAALPIAVGPTPNAAHHFHGDGRGSEVYVVHADGLLGGGEDAALGEHSSQLDLSATHMGSPLLASACPLHQSRVGVGLPAASLMRPLDSRRTGAQLDTRIAQASHHGALGAFETFTDCLRAEPAFIESDALVDGCESGSRTGARDVRSRITKQRPERRPAHADRGRYLANRLTGLVAPEEVVKVEVTSYSGQVYNLSTEDGWHLANGFAVYQCRQKWHPVEYDQRELPETLELGRTSGPVLGTETLIGRAGGRDEAVDFVQRMRE